MAILWILIMWPCCPMGACIFSALLCRMLGSSVVLQAIMLVLLLCLQMLLSMVCMQYNIRSTCSSDRVRIGDCGLSTKVHICTNTSKKVLKCKGGSVLLITYVIGSHLGKFSLNYFFKCVVCNLHVNLLYSLNHLCSFMVYYYLFGVFLP